MVSTINARACETLATKIADHSFNLVVAGEFKRGKSTLINALIGADLLPTGVVPLTSVVTVLKYGLTPAANVVFENSVVQEVKLGDLMSFVTERGNPQNEKRVREVAVTLPAECLKEGIQLIDTPGIGSVHAHNTDMTLRYLPQADAVIFVASADQPISRTELDFLGEIRRYAGKIFCLLNKIDHLSPTEQAESLAFASEAVTRALDARSPVFAVSARLALQGRSAGDAVMLESSGLPAFEAALQHFLMEESGMVWQRSMRQHTLRLLGEGRLSAELELRAQSSDIDVLDENLRELAAKKRELLQSASDASAILAAAIREMFTKQIAPRLDEFKNTLTSHLQAGLSVWCSDVRDGGEAATYALLEARLLGEVRRACEIWEAETDAIVQAEFGALCKRLMRGIQDGVNDVMLYSANLFNISFTPIDADTIWRSHSQFSIKAWDEPPGLKVLTNALVSMLPAAISNAHIVREAKRRAMDLVDMHAGRLRHEFEERINSNAQTFQRDLVHGIETTLAGIEVAIEKGKKFQQLGAVQILPRRTELGEILAEIRLLEDRVRCDS